MMEWIQKTWQRFDEFWFGQVDSRVYALLRIVFAIVALANLIDLWPDRFAFFADTGIVDLEVTKQNIGHAPRFSVFFLSSSEAMVTGTMLVAAGALVCLALGVFPRIAAVLAFVWQLSYSHRSFPIIHGWDVLLRILALFIMISPMGSRMRLPNLWLPREPEKQPEKKVEYVPRYGLNLIQIQLAVVYWQTVWLKLDDIYWRNGEFFSYFMMSMYSRFQSRAWAEWQTLSCIMTYSTLAIELALPFLLYFKRTRWFGFFLGFGLHFGILVTSRIWLFSIVVLIPYLAFLDGDDVKQLKSASKWTLSRLGIGKN